MDEMKAKAALRDVARMYGVSLEVVIEEIDLVIKQGFASTDPVIRSRWEQMSCKGTCPTAAEVVAHLAKIASKQRK